MDNLKFNYRNTYHHLYNRGIDRNAIFFEEYDYQYFLRKTRECKEKYSVNVNCYCLLPNHFHLFVKQLKNEFSVGRFIGTLTNSYTKGINKKYGRTGMLFEGRTKNKLITDDKYFLFLCKYIINNPVNAGLVKNPEDWKYSSAGKYFDISEDNITDEKEIIEMFKSTDDFVSFVNKKEIVFDYSQIF